MKRIVLTGGGTAGHVTPNMALVPKLIDEGYDIAYIGSYNGMERKLIDDIGVPYYGISSGKLRRYFDLKNFSDPFRVIKGFFEAKKILKKLKPDVVFSKGGFVTVPVVIAAKKLHIPVIIHESDMTPGLANKLSIPSASKVCCNFPETISHLPEGKAVLTGSPIRQELFQGQKEEGLRLCKFTSDKPVLLVIGGSLGSVAINQAIRSNLKVLLEKYQIIHLCGRNNLDETLKDTKGYQQFEYVKKELKHYFACADIVVSRAGANAICELLAIRKPNILIPLGLEASRGDQILNAQSFEKQGYSYVLQEKDVTSETLLQAINQVYENRADYIHAMNESKLANPIETIVGLANELSAKTHS
jgi:UDP-N-acetylglucosamine--N-acetylmuramyl-(pentapeptide) pyrophosphoryl-undecaprenol N-acetylglucosamine transferase